MEAACLGVSGSWCYPTIGSADPPYNCEHPRDHARLRVKGLQ
jgi:hypothetical protein